MNKANPIVRQALEQAPLTAWARQVVSVWYGAAAGRYIPLSIVTTPQVDHEPFYTQCKRVRRNEQLYYRQVEGDPLSA